MDLKDALSVLRRRWISIVLVTLFALGATVAWTLTVTPKFTSTTRLFFGVQGGESATDLAQGSTFTQKQMSSYAEVATSPLVLNSVIQKLRLETTSDELAVKVVATSTPDTVILEVAATDLDRARAAAVANAVGEGVSAVAGRLSPEREDGSQAVRATILAVAVPSTKPSSPVVLRNVLIGALLGLGVGIVIALIRHALDTKIRGEQDIKAVTDGAILGVVPFDQGAPEHPVVMHDDPLGARSEAMRRLRTNLQFVEVASSLPSILVTSSIAGEGKSTTALNLAVTLSDAGRKVVLIDGDLRRPSIATYLGLEGNAGLTTILIGKAQIEDVVQPWGDTSLDIITSGSIPPNPSELLSSKRMTQLLAKLAETYDTVVVDSSPLLPVTDAAILSQVTGGTLVVVGADRIHRPQFREAIDSLSAVRANVIGYVLNKVARQNSSNYVYYSGYYASPDSPSRIDAGESDTPESTLNDTHRPTSEPSVASLS